MLTGIKWFLYSWIILIIAAGFWLLPKYSYIHSNLGYCSELLPQVYFCGKQAQLDALFNLTGK
jgi:hypothetical protein